MLRLFTLTKRKWAENFAGAWLFYTILPKPPWIKSDFKHIARFAPIIGILIGTFQSLIWLFFSKLGWTNYSLILITLPIGIWITGGLHFDGLADTADGLAAGPKKRLQAMKDSRVGAAGVQALIINIFFQVAALIQIGEMAPIAFPIASFWGRFSPLFAMENFSYLHKNETKSLHLNYWEGFWKEIIPSILILCLILTGLFLTPLETYNRIYIFSLIIIGIFPAIIIPYIIGRKLGGHSGDSYGASLVIVETITLFLLAMILGSN